MRDKVHLLKQHIPPWQDSDEWEQVGLFFKTSKKCEKQLSEARSLAREIARKIEFIDADLERLCQNTCPSCDEVCCFKATIWYDFNDLLSIFLLKGELPEEQIIRKKHQPCPMLTYQGCRLNRIDRPFICTWYICPAQQEIISRESSKEDSNTELTKLLKEIQSDRKKLEEIFHAVLVEQ